MAKKEDIVKLVESLANKADLKKLARLEALVPELKLIDELLGHNAETARDQAKQQAQSLLSNIPDEDKASIINLLPRATAESLTIALQMLNYDFKPQIALIFHIDDLIVTDHDIPQIRTELIPYFTQFIANHPTAHMVFLSHDSADVTTILITALVGGVAIADGRVSIVYESGLGLYLGGDKKEKKDFTEGVRGEITQVMDRVALAASSMSKDQNIRDKFYFSSTEFSCGIRVHPFARGTDNSLDKDAAKMLMLCFATALADLVKEDVEAVQNHATNFFLNADPSLSGIFAAQPDDRLWDMERIDQYLNKISFVHLGSRGSVIRPGEITDIPAVETVLQAIGKDIFVAVCGDNRFSLPIMQWAAKLPSGMVSCSEGADVMIRRLVERTGGIEYASGNIAEIMVILDSYLTIKTLIK
ncbi:MAG: hypothetical protein WC773_02500 [Patescibacteria group bacterium]